MASVEAYTSVKSAIATNLAPVEVFDFDTFDESAQQDEVGFIVLEEVTEDEDMIGFGGNLCHRETGILTAHHFTPAPESSSAARQFAENTADLLRSQVLSNNLRIFAVDPPTPTAYNNGLWTIYSVPISYEFDTTRPHPTPLP